MDRIKILKDQLKVYRTSGENYKRFGNAHDGGYVMVDDLVETDYVISCGIGDNKVFVADAAVEKDMSKKTAGVDMYDIFNVNTNGMPDKLRFFQKELGLQFGLKDMILIAEEQKDYILKMDIEGAEWPVFFNADSKDIAKFRQMVIEIHDIGSHILNGDAFDNMISVFEKINKTHKLVLIHANNHAPVFPINLQRIPQVVEVLFLRKDSYNFVDIDYPESLTSPCKPEAEDLSLFYS